MSRNITISIDDRVYDGLHAILGQRTNIGKFLEDLARQMVVNASLKVPYLEMSADTIREAEADEWCESFAADGPDAAW